MTIFDSVNDYFERHRAEEHDGGGVDLMTVLIVLGILVAIVLLIKFTTLTVD